MSVHEVFHREEQRCLITGAPPFCGSVQRQTTASGTCLVLFDHNRYSALARAAGRPVELRGHADHVEIFLDGACVGSHVRRYGRREVAQDVTHFIPILERKPGALRNGAPFRAENLPAPLAEIRTRLVERGDNGADMVRLLLAVGEHGLDAVTAACAEALEAGIGNVEIILHALARQRDPGPAPSAAVPEAIPVRANPPSQSGRRRQTPATDRWTDASGTPAPSCSADNASSALSAMKALLGAAASQDAIQNPPAALREPGARPRKREPSARRRIPTSSAPVRSTRASRHRNTALPLASA